MRSFGEIMSSKMKVAYGVQEALHNDLVRIQGAVTQEVTDLRDRLNEITDVADGLRQAVEAINQKMADLDVISVQIGRQYSTMGAAMGIGKESETVSEEQSDLLADGASLAISRKAIFLEDDKLVSEVLTGIKPEFLVKALQRLDKKEREKLQEALEGVII